MFIQFLCLRPLSLSAKLNFIEVRFVFMVQGKQPGIIGKL